MFSITFTALSNLLQIKARICMFLCGTPAVHKGLWRFSQARELSHSPCVPVVPLPGPCPAMGTVGWMRSAVPLQGVPKRKVGLRGSSRAHLPQPPRHQHTFYF